ncbi:hypothetical protein ES703_99570 [subsurface metagenome]
MTKLGRILKERGIKQKWLAEKIGVSEATVSNWVKGRHTPQPEFMFEFCRLLNIDVQDYLAEED